MDTTVKGVLLGRHPILKLGIPRRGRCLLECRVSCLLGRIILALKMRVSTLNGVFLLKKLYHNTGHPKREGANCEQLHNDFALKIACMYDTNSIKSFTLAAIGFLGIRPMHIHSEVFLWFYNKILLD